MAEESTSQGQIDDQQNDDFNEQRESKTDDTTTACASRNLAESTQGSKCVEVSERKSISQRPDDSKVKSKPSLEAKQSIETKRRQSETLKSKTEARASTEARISTDVRASAEARPTIEIKRSRDGVSPQESRKSVASLGMRISKDVSKDLFARKKSSRSIGKAVGSVVSFRRGSIAEYFDRQKTAKFMNTYKLESDKPFNVDKVEKILKEVLIEALDNLTYDADKVPKQAKWASNVIRSKVKEHEFDRYKLICNVTIGEKRSQDMYATYRFLWDADRDKHASYVHENMYVFAIAVCFGIYYE